MAINQRKAGVILSYIQMAAGSVIMLIYTPIMLRLLGQTEYGIYNLASSVTGYLSLFNFGFSSAYVRYHMRYKVAGDEEKLKSLNGMFLLIFLFLSTLILIAGAVLVANTHLVFKSNLSAEEIYRTKIVMVVLTVNMALVLPVNIFSANITLNERYVYQRSVQLLKTFLHPFAILPVLFLGGKSIALVVASLFFSVFIESFFVIYALKKLKMKFSFKNFDFKIILSIGRFSTFIFLNMLIDRFNASVDKILLGIYKGVTAVAIYGLAATLRMYFTSFSSLIYSVFIPEIHRLVNTGDKDKELTELFTKTGRIQFYILSLITLGFAVFGKQFMIIWGGKEYADAYLIALILLITSIIPLIQNTAEEIQRAKNMHHYRTAVYGSIVLVNILISIPLCKAYGALGCTIGTAFASFAGSGVALNIIFKKKIGLDVNYFWKNIAAILPGFIPSIILGALIIKFVPLGNIIYFLASGAVFVLVYCAAVWFTVMNDYEKSLISGLLEKALAIIKKKF